MSPSTDTSAGRLALVTGASAGVGLAVAQRLRSRGYRFIAVGRTPFTANRASLAIGGDALPVACDMSDPVAVSELSTRIRKEWSDNLEILVCNAEVILPSGAGDTDDAEIELQIDVNLTSVIRLISAALPGFLKNERGHILATSSMGAIRPMPGSAVYSGSKAGLRAYLAAISAELRLTKVKVSGIYPSGVDTDLLHKEAKDGGSPLNFVGSIYTVDDVATAYERALDTGKLELFIPYSDSILSRFVQAYPRFLPRLLPPLDKIGRRGMAKYLSERDRRG